MALQSMTGFGKGESCNDDYTVAVELKSVNHRFKDLRFKMPSIFNSIELDLRRAISTKFKRGSFDISINFKRTAVNSKFDDIDENKVEAYLTRMKKLVEGKGLALNIQPTEFLRNEFLKDQDISKDPEVFRLAKEAFNMAIEALVTSRNEEGAKMQEIIESHRSDYDDFFQAITSQTSGFQKSVEEKLLKRFNDYKEELSVDEPRFMQEVIYYLEKLDVDEEINRIGAHLKKLDQILLSKGEVGRQMDFLIQELNRETNTIGSKSNLKEISDQVVQMKIQLEKIREQGLNLE